MQTQDIRLDAGQSHFAWLDKGCRLIVLDGALAVTWRDRTLDWLPDAPLTVRRVLTEGECLTMDTSGHVALAAGAGAGARVTIAAAAGRYGWRDRLQAWLSRLPARLSASPRVRGEQS